MNLTGWLVATQPRTWCVSTQQYSRSGHKPVVSCSFLIYSFMSPSCFHRCLLPSAALKSSLMNPAVKVSKFLQLMD